MSQVISDGTTEHFILDRAMEFFSEDELSKQIGYMRSWWAAAILKDIIDNGLDAAEKAGTAPAIAVTVSDDRFAVRDNGPGIPWHVVERSLDYTCRVTDKAFFVSPTRGRQGNALKTIWAAPFVVGGGRGTVEVDAHGEHRAIEVTTNPLKQTPVFSTVPKPGFVKTGSIFTLHWPQVASYLTPENDIDFYGDTTRDWSGEEDLSGGMRSALMLVRAFALFNPHAEFTLTSPDGKEFRCGARAANWKKWTGANPSPPHWYSAEQVADLATAYLRADREAKRPVRSVRAFIGQFRGLKGTLKQREVYETAGVAAECLDGLFDGSDRPDYHQVRRLLAAMRDASRPVSPKDLGVIGRKQMTDGLRQVFGLDGDIRYRCESGEVGGVPFVLEVGFGYRQRHDQKRIVVAGVNWSPALRLPFEGLSDALQESRVDDRDPVVVAIHLAYPGAIATDRGKSRYDLPREITGAVVNLVGEAAQKWRKKKLAADRVTQRVERDRFEAVKRGKRSEQDEIKQAAYDVMAEAYKQADGGVGVAGARQIMYAARGLLLNRPGSPCWKKSSYFTQKLLPDYLRCHPEETASWDVVFDARGHFREPHTGKRIDLGTLGVRDYLSEWTDARSSAIPDVSLPHAFPTLGPTNRYKFVLFVEKEGFNPLLDRSQICERYDIGRMTTKGMSVTAARTLVERLSGAGVTILVLHDFDKSGFSILHTLRSNTRRYQFRTEPRVVDIGLRLADARTMGLLSEAVTYDCKIDPKIRLLKCGATAEEAEFLVSGGQTGKKLWEGERIELNAMTSKQFVEFVERKLAEVGVTKLIPDDATLTAAYQRACRIAQTEAAMTEAIRKANAQPAAVPPSDLTAKLRNYLKNHPAASWDDAVLQTAKSSALRKKAPARKAPAREIAR